MVKKGKELKAISMSCTPHSNKKKFSDEKESERMKRYYPQ